MDSVYYSGRAKDPFFIETEKLLEPLMDAVQSCEPQACQKAIVLMYQVISRMPVTFFKDPVYTEQVLEAIKFYLKSGDIETIRKLARKRKTDRLRLRRAIACDCLEYFSFLPMQFEADPANIYRYVENLDNMLWLLRVEDHNKDCMQRLKIYLKHL